MTRAALSVSHWLPDESAALLDTSVGDILRSATAQAADAPALVLGTFREPRRTYRYCDLLRESERVARALLARFHPGERIAACASNSLEWVTLEFGAALAGLVLVPVDPAFRAQELAHVLRHSRAAGVFLAEEHHGRALPDVVESVRYSLPGLRERIGFSGVSWARFMEAGSPTERLPPVRPEDQVQIQYTSGTTGVPKGAILHHRGVTNNSRFFARCLEIGPADVLVDPMPLFHAGGCLMMTLGSVHGRAAHVLMATYSPGLHLSLIEAMRGTVLAGVPTMLAAALTHAAPGRRDLSSLRCAVVGGAIVPPDLVRTVESRLGVPVAITYGQTEASPCVSQTRLHDSPQGRAETVGLPLPWTEARVVDPMTGRVAPVGTVGEICVRGYLVMHGYLDDEVATAEAIDRDRWLHTGDLGSMDECGRLRIVSRLKDMIIKGGENIYPREIEEVLRSHRAIADAAVIGVPDERWGEQVAAFVQAAPGQDAAPRELAAFCRARLAPQKVPRYWLPIEALPRTPSGKVQKFLLRERFDAERPRG